MLEGRQTAALEGFPKGFFIDWDFLIEWNSFVAGLSSSSRSGGVFVAWRWMGMQAGYSSDSLFSSLALMSFFRGCDVDLKRLESC